MAEAVDRRAAERRSIERRIGGGTGYQGVERRMAERRSGLDRRTEDRRLAAR